MATLRQTFSDIASAIRAKGVSGTMKPIEMASKIGEIQQGIDYGYLTFTAEEATTLTLNQDGEIEPHKLLKSTDGVNWTKWENPSTNGISLNAGESVYLKADEDALWRTATGKDICNKFYSTGKIKCYGDIRALVKPIALEDYSYFAHKMFNGCASLTQAPELPATTLANNCYDGMFDWCKSLTTAPELPATTLAEYCYSTMFSACSSLTKAPSVLPATTLAKNCYNFMFGSCTSLTIAPTLPATTLVDGCYTGMFQNCTSLKRIKMNASTGGLSWGMLSGCTSLELVDMTGSTGAPWLDQSVFSNTNDTYKIVVPDSLYDTWIEANNWASIASHIMKQTDWNAAHPDDILG